MREYVGDRAGDPARRGPAAGRALPLLVPLHGLRAAPRHPDLPRRPLPPACCASPARSPTAWCCGSATRTTSADVVADGRRGPRAGRQAAGGLRHRGGRPGRRDKRPRAGDAAALARLIPYFSLPFYRKMIELSGFGDDLAALRQGWPRATATAMAISDGSSPPGRDRQRGGGRRVVRRYADSGRPRPAWAGSRRRTSTRRSRRSPAAWGSPRLGCPQRRSRPETAPGARWARGPLWGYPRDA